MALSPGTRLGHYNVTALLGEGGMGQVWQATDTQLNREVALKILPDAFAADPDRLARFMREAQILASLNHPNIATIYGIEEADDTRALVLELVEGPTLADRIKQGPIPIDEALPIAKQIAEALEAAHEAGVIHRDLKPANIKVREDGTVKVLDFGLAKALDPSPEADPSQSPTLTAAATQMGVILGTAAYMSPEQARGKTVDKRTDVWAFGCVLYEMLTGRRAFEGNDITDILAAIVRAEPEWAEIPPDVHSAVRLLLERCLDKDLRRRKQSIADVRAELETLPAHAEVDVKTVPDRDGSRNWLRTTAVPALVAVSVAAIVILAVRSPEPAAEPTMRFPIALPANQQPGDFSGGIIAISPDGRSIVIAGQDQLYLRTTDAIDTTPVPGSEGAEGAFFSPDSRWIGFFASGSVHKVLVEGGSPQRIGGVPGFPSGASWGSDDVIVIGAALNGLVTIAADAGSVQSPLTNTGLAFSDERHLSPQVLPNGRNVVFLLEEQNRSYVAVASLETGDYWPLFPGGVPRYLETTGHLVYEDGGNLMAIPFDPVALEATGDPGLALEGVFSYRWDSSNISYYAISDEGTLAYVPGGEVEFRQSTRLVWVDRNGATRPFGEDVNDHFYPRLHPGGGQVAVSRQDDSGRNIYLYDVNRPTAERFTSEGINYISAWMPTGEGLIYQRLFSKSLDSVNSEKLPLETTGSSYKCMQAEEG